MKKMIIGVGVIGALILFYIFASPYLTVYHWIRNHDNILFYVKDPNNFTFNKKYIRYPEVLIVKTFDPLSEDKNDPP